MLRKIYKIWKIQRDVNFRPSVDWVEYDPEKKPWAYPLVRIIDQLPDRWRREYMIGVVPDGMEQFLDYLNQIADLDEYYEIQEEEVDDGL